MYMRNFYICKHCAFVFPPTKSITVMEKYIYVFMERHKEVYRKKMFLFASGNVFLY